MDGNPNYRPNTAYKSFWVRGNPEASFHPDSMFWVFGLFLSLEGMGYLVGCPKPDWVTVSKIVDRPSVGDALTNICSASELIRNTTNHPNYCESLEILLTQLTVSNQTGEVTMLQIRLINNKGSSSEGGTGGGGGSKQLPVETVTVACPDHLVLADLPVAKCIGNVTSATNVKSIGRRSRRLLGERVHFCVRCDFPIAIYGRLSPCEHAFCLDCARSDSSCYLCDERIQKIQTIKMMEGIYVCAAPHCLKSFLKRSDFESHVNENHADLLQSNIEKEDGNESDNFNVMRSTSADAQAKQSIPAESSTARAPTPRPGFSPSSNSQPHDFEDKTLRFVPREQTPLRPPLPMNMMQPRPPPFYAPNYPPHSHQPPSFLVPVSVNQGTNPPTFNYAPFTPEGAQPFYTTHYELPRTDSAPEGGSEQSSLLGFPPPPGFAPWDMGVATMQFQQIPISMGQGAPEGYTNFQGGFPLSSPFMPPVGTRPLEPPQIAVPLDQKDGKGVLAPLPFTPPPPHLTQNNTRNFSHSGDTVMEGQGY
ncbi:hypothetical protein GIB67_007593 [Kingdonia uniflora]|uniref:RING-type E3 ubiquitin transferase n=1 Tax=Kingdonia uniflora TaxID=39325 RepID=A0A7J7N1R3_9MAGN|nr:hypothetical protein GIB67_007593 [Kingdonia uniflora]